MAPTATGNVIITSPGPTLDGIKNIATLIVAGTGSINLATFSLTCSGTASVNGGVISTGTLSAAQFSAFSSNMCTDLILIHTGNNASIAEGGNTFNGTTEIHLTGGQSLTFGNTLGDTFNGNVTFRNAATNNARTLTIANNGRTVITGNAILSASATATAGVVIGGTGVNTGTCEIQGTIEAGTYAAAATLTLRRVKQVAATPNSVFSIANFVALNDTLNGTFTLTGTTSISLTNSQFLNTCSFSSSSYAALTGNRFATTAGTVSLAKTGAGTTTAAGGNTFGPGSITLTGTGGLRLANTKGDTCTSDFTFVNNSTGQVIDVSYNGINIFGGNVTLQNSSSTGILFSPSTTGRSVITGSILNGGYTAGPLTLQRVKQVSTSPNGTFTVTTFTANGDTLNGDIAVTANTAHALTNSFFERNCTFSGVHFSSMQGCRFATTSGTATITKTGAGNSNANGGNTFGTAIITNSATTTNSQLQMSTTTGDTYLGNVSLVNSSTGQLILLSQAGITTIAGNLSLQNSSTAGYIIGAPTTGRIVLSGILVNGTYSGPLTMRRLKQVSTSANDAFTLTAFTALSDTLNGAFTMTTTGATSLTTSWFENTTSFTAANYGAMLSCRLATTTGAATITQTGATNSYLAGSNTFGPLTVNHSGAGVQLRFASTAADTFLSNVTLNNLAATSVLTICYAGINTIAGNLTFAGTSTAGTLVGNGAAGGTTVLSGVLIDGGYTPGAITLARVRQTSLAANGPFSIANFTALNDTISGDISVTVSAVHSLTNAIFERNCTFVGASIGTLQGCRLATTSGTAVITKTGAGSNNTNGGNTFGTAIITNSATTINSQLQMSTTTGDTYLANVSLVNSSTGQLILLSQAGTTTIAGNLSLQNSSTAGIIIGATGAGRTVLSGILVNGTYSGPLTMRRLKQVSTSANEAFSIANFTALNDTISGDISITTSAGQSLTTSIFERNCTFIGAQITTLTGNQLATTVGSAAVISKTGLTDNDLAGGNTFGPITINHSGVGARLRFANTTGDTYLGNVTLNNQTVANSLTICFAGKNTIEGDVMFTGTSTLGTFMGNSTAVATSGTTVLSGVLKDGGFPLGAITLVRVKQTNLAANGPFSIANFTAVSDTLSGDISVTVSAIHSLTNAIFERNSTFIGAQIVTLQGNRFSTVSGTTTITKTGATANTPAGGNTFGRDAVISLTGAAANLQMSSTTGDTYLANVSFVNISPASNLTLSFAGTTAIAGNASLQNSSTGGIIFGQSATLGRTVLSGNLLNTAYAGGPLTLRKVRQLSTTANDAFAPTAFTALNDTLSGDMTITTAGAHSLTASIFERNCTFVGAQISELRGCSLATVSGTAIVTKTGITGNTPYGGNTFGPVVITLGAAATGSLTMSNTAGDTYLTDATFVNASATAGLTISWNGKTTVAGNVNLQNSSTGGITLGQSATLGYTLITGRLLNTAYAGGPLTLRKVRQLSTTANDAFSLTAFTALNDTISGDISVTTSAGQSLTNSIFERNCTFVGAQINTLSGNKLATISGTATLTKTGANGNTSAGGNTFGEAIITLGATATNTWTMAGTTGDTYLANATFVNVCAAANALTLSNAGRTTVAGNVNLQNSSGGGITIGPIGPATGTTLIQGTIQNLGYANGLLSIRRTRQVSASANGTFAPTAFAANTDTLSGAITVNATASINLNSTWFETSCTLVAPSIGSMVNCKFSVLSGTTILTKTGTTTTDDVWAGANRFGNVVITNATNRYIRMTNAAASPDTFMAGTTATFVRTGTGTLTPAYTSDVRVEGNISTAGSTGAITFAQAIPTGARVLIMGNAAQTFTGGGAATTFTRMTMNTTGTFSLNNNLNIGTDVTFTAGNVVTSALGLLILNAGSTATGASNASFVDGPVRKIGNTAFTYPTGDGSTYGPCALTGGGAATDNYTATYFRADPNPTYNTSSYDFPLQKVSDVEYWDIQRTNGGGTPGLTLFWGPHSGGVNDPNNLMVVRWGGASWGSMGGVSHSGTPTSGSVSTGGTLGTFGIFSFGSNSSGMANLPVVLSAWQAEKLANTVLLSWQTEREENVSHFEIERSGDNTAFSGIGQVLAAGNSYALTDYDWTDPNPLPETSYYRLRMVDIDGQLALSEVLTVIRGGEGQATASFYPNPVQDYVHVTSSVLLPLHTRIALVDQQGKLLYTIVIAHDGYSFEVDTRELPSGIYHLRFDTEFAMPAVRFVIER